ncbi:hypothetical protein F5B22DRAFT_477505 [Xylaria bambusicola]|uniref:uncharacterized protein n=1 Tax=Xylaria bambusicola TaxID=326684 RepID=UPI0020073028|nr:uncharacterized protein F5B22DRAFT_477505 [Xylaria bambusicola]KAI0506196.1 hypothetical protein F5B22DRAFT_477505 [Xylaria bambusicola]
MAGHNFSRYVLNLWSAVFAPFNFIFTHIWRLYTRAIEKRDIASLSPSQPSASPTSTSPTSVASHAATTDSATPTTTIAAGSSSAPSVSPLGLHRLHDQHSSHSIVDEDLPDHTTPNGVDSGNSDTDLDSTVTSSSHDHQHRELRDMAKKRGGRGRGGVKPSLHQATTVNPVAPVTPATATGTITDDTVKDWTASSTQSDPGASGDTSLTPIHPNSPAFTPSKRESNGIRGRSSAIPQQKQPADDSKENLVFPKHDDSVSRAVQSGSPALPLLAVMNSTREARKTDTRSDTDFDSSSTAHTTNTVYDESSTSLSEADQLHVVADRLTLGDAPSAKHIVQRTLNDATSAAEASALPVPLVVAVPILPQLQTTHGEHQTLSAPSLPGLIEPTTDEGRAEREYHLRFMRAALDMGDLALRTNETPVGCVLVYKGRVIARGMNATNVTRNGTRHAEFMALSALLSRRQSSDIKVTDINMDLDEAAWGDVDPRDGHIYPYGQKLHPAPIVDRSIISECVLYVTVEPCVMCASLLRQLGIKKVYFGAVNDKFGGTGGVFRVHMNSKPVPIPKDRPYQLGYGPQDLSLISKGKAVALPRDDDEGDGGNVERGYPVEGGYLRDDAVSLLRRFYVQENGRAPQPRKKEGRAARLYAAMEGQNKPTNTSDLSDNGPETPVEIEAPVALNGKPESAISVVCV